MKKYLVFTSCAVVLCCGALIYQNSRRKRGDEIINLAQSAAGSSQNKISIKFLASWDCDAWTRNVTFSRDDKWLLLGSFPTEIYQTSDWSLFRKLRGQDAADFSPDGTLVAASNAAPQKNSPQENAPGVGIWRAADGRQMRLLNDKSGLDSAVGAWGPVAFSPDGRRLLTVGEDPNTTWRPGWGSNTEASTIRQIALKVWDVSSGQRLQVLPGPNRGVNADTPSVAWVRTSPEREGKFEPHYFNGSDGICQLFDRTLVVQIVGGRQKLAIKDLTKKQLIRDIAVGETMRAAALSPDGKWVVSSWSGQFVGSNRRRGTIAIWRVSDGELLAKFETESVSTRAITFSGDGKTLVVVGGSDTNGIASVYTLEF